MKTDNEKHMSACVHMWMLVCEKDKRENICAQLDGCFISASPNEGRMSD